MTEEPKKALIILGKEAAILYESALEESKSEEMSKNIVYEFMRALLRPDSNRFFI